MRSIFRLEFERGEEGEVYVNTPLKLDSNEGTEFNNHDAFETIAEAASEVSRFMYDMEHYEMDNLFALEEVIPESEAPPLLRKYLGIIRNPVFGVDEWERVSLRFDVRYNEMFSFKVIMTDFDKIYTVMRDAKAEHVAGLDGKACEWEGDGNFINLFNRVLNI